MTDRGYIRRFVRAPINERILYRDSNGIVRKALLGNISEGGALALNLETLKKGQTVDVILGIPQMPVLNTNDAQKLKSHSIKKYRLRPIKVMAKIVRFDEKPEDNLTAYGLEFHSIQDEYKETLVKYVETFSTNMIQMVRLFQKSDNESKNKVILTSKILGYDQKTLEDLKKIVFHDYRSFREEG